MRIYERIKILCKENNITITGLELDLGFSRGSLSKIDNHKPSRERIDKISNYFDILPEWLMGTSEFKNKSELYSGLSNIKNLEYKNLGCSEHEQKLLDNFRNLNSDGQNKLLDYADDLFSSGKYIKSDLLEQKKKA